MKYSIHLVQSGFSGSYDNLSLSALSRCLREAIRQDPLVEFSIKVKDAFGNYNMIPGIGWDTGSVALIITMLRQRYEHKGA